MKTYRQLSFSEKIKWRNRALGVLLVLMLAYMVLVGELGLGDSRVMSTLADDVSRLIFFGGMIWIVYKIILNNKLLKNKQMLKDKLKNEQDERRLYLHDKSGGMVWDILFVCLMFITLTTSLINMPAFYTALVILILAIALKAGTYLMYKKGK